MAFLVTSFHPLGWSATALQLQTVRALTIDEANKLYVTAARARGQAGIPAFGCVIQFDTLLVLWSTQLDLTSTESSTIYPLLLPSYF